MGISFRTLAGRLLSTITRSDRLIASDRSWVMRMAVFPAERMIRLIAVGDPFGGLLGGAETVHVRAGAGPVPAAVRLEIDAEEGFGSDGAAEVGDFGGTDLIGVDTLPGEIEHRTPFPAGTDRLFPVVVAGEAAAPADHRRREFADDFDRGGLPLFGDVVPGGVDRGIGVAERFRELHGEIGRNRVKRPGINLNHIGIFHAH